MQHPISRRQAILAGLFGSSGIGLRALASGLPAGFLRDPLNPAASRAAAAASTAQALVLASSGAGDPLGNNAPGTYSDPAIVHPGAAATQGMSYTLGGNTVTGAAAWSALPQAVLDRLAFVHHSTYTSVHTDYGQVLTLMGQVANRDTLLSQCALALAPQLKSTQTAPVALGDSIQSFQNNALAYLPPSALKLVFGAIQSPLLNLQKLRNDTVDSLNAILKQSGNRSQRAFMDNMVQSRGDAHALGVSLASDLSNIKDDSGASQLLAAASLLRMNVCPVVSVSLDFGGDNHSDANLAYEAQALPNAVSAIAAFYAQLQSYKIADSTTFAAINVFGRTFTSLGTAGRNHWGQACCALIMGSNVKGGVYGGVMPAGGEFQATGMDAASGAAVPNGGSIPYEQLLTSTGKTIARAAGIDLTTVNAMVGTGQVISAALS